ncbi:hypothetical protein [Acidiferrobacter sp.]|uniref:hypothetical protein n=1 Tax=Acidiferrobacter sp. TaxID=1872107 RepID=UPI00261B0C38|nr:hypothetical protein [Acidiferrobacter sp.]
MGEVTDKGAFQAALTGPFSGIVSWAQLTDLWTTVRSRPEGWYIYAIGEPAPTMPASGEALVRFTEELDTLLRREHREDYCGIVYADDKAQPSFIKVFDPHNLGSSCGSSGLKTLPGWLLTRMPPETLDDPRPLPESRKRWWRGLFQRQSA